MPSVTQFQTFGYVHIAASLAPLKRQLPEAQPRSQGRYKLWRLHLTLGTSPLRIAPHSFAIAFCNTTTLF